MFSHLVAALNQMNDLEFTKENLELGDITFEVNNKTIILIERKKMPDLSNSLYDGRYKEQKKRIKEALHPNVRKIYLIEGNSFFKTKLNKKTLDGIKINTMLRDNLHIKHVKNFDETVEFIVNIYKRIGKYVIIFNGEIYNHLVLRKNLKTYTCKILQVLEKMTKKITLIVKSAILIKKRT